MKQRVFIALIVALMLPAVASAQLITSSQTITVKEKRLLSPVEPGYEQSAEVYFLGMTDMAFMQGDRLHFTPAFGADYIGGYRFNNYLFVGAGVGAEIPFGRYILFDHVSLTRGTTFPVFAHVRANFLNRRCSPFFALSAGARFMIPQEISISMNPDVYYKYNYISAFVNPQLGVNFRVTPKTSIYLSVGVNGYTEEELSAINYYQVLCKPRYFLGFDLHLGVTF